MRLHAVVEGRDRAAHRGGQIISIPRPKLMLQLTHEELVRRIDRSRRVVAQHQQVVSICLGGSKIHRHGIVGRGRHERSSDIRQGGQIAHVIQSVRKSGCVERAVARNIHHTNAPRVFLVRDTQPQRQNQQDSHGQSPQQAELVRERRPPENAIVILDGRQTEAGFQEEEHVRRDALETLAHNAQREAQHDDLPGVLEFGGIA